MKKRVTRPKTRPKLFNQNKNPYKIRVYSLYGDRYGNVNRSF